MTLPHRLAATAGLLFFPVGCGVFVMDVLLRKEPDKQTDAGLFTFILVGGLILWSFGNGAT
ncbi:hypothetical protein ELY33_05005 [Vreelandella andesensis]|uniref:Uncharacterized protein n=1 Tax=Vreelandella andesensis TaxID=447567 RepID=A0A3S0Y588_9GAMM|nr:hypothetical protein [Halomonas andesensis]RUR32741.1 hypothetical protein ELY33_05005 [Halomonas andesensis]